jgi:GT2 family glycosyltransferase
MEKNLARPEVAIIVLNWNNPSDTLDCLGSLKSLDYPNYKVFVLDNGSSDNSVARIQTAFPKIKILETGRNLGYAGGNNVGIRYALSIGAKYICILNNDVVVTPGCITSLVDTLELDKSAGIATPLITDLTDATLAWTLGACIEWQTASVRRMYAGEPVVELLDLKDFEVEIAPGSSMMVKRDVFELVGLPEEGYFLYFEEADWCIFVRNAGFKIMAVPDAIVKHKVSATLGTTSPVTDYYMARNHIRFIRRHWNGLELLRLLVGAYLGQIATIIAYTIEPRESQRRPNRNARVYALRDGLLGRWGEMGDDVARVCYPKFTVVTERDLGDHYTDGRF